jgi:secreted trypsin-like serine protease
MKIKVAGVLVLVLLFATSTPTQAIEGGTDATADSYVVPVYNEDSVSTCSGALIASKVIVTAAHCITDKNGLPAKNIWVGPPGDNIETALLKQNRIEKIELSPSYSAASNGKVADDDLAFLIPENEIRQKNFVYLASKVENESLKQSGVPLRVFGYGETDNLVSKDTKFPNTFMGNYTTTVNALYPNSGFLKSTAGRTCKGDSGGPVFYVSVSRTVLVGIVSGSIRDVNCAKKESDGSYVTMFTEISKYANLAFAASSYAAISTQATVNAEYASDEAEIAELKALILELETQNEALNIASSKLVNCLNSAKKIIKTKKGKLAKGC